MIFSLRVNVTKIFRVSEHVEDDLDLPMADLTEILQLEDQEIVSDPTLIANLEEVVMGWERLIVKLIENYLAKVNGAQRCRELLE